MAKSEPKTGEIVHKMIDVAEAEPLLPNATETSFPFAPFVQARTMKVDRKFPQAIAHRGYKAKFPENTMAAFRGAVEAGAHALETDIHLTKDDVVVLSHDADLKRCFGNERKIIDCDWEYLSTLRTTAEPSQPLPRLKELLEYVASPKYDQLWVLLDIKMDNNADDVMRLIAETIDQVPPSPGRPWHERLVLGIWATKYVALCNKYSPGFPISHIGFSTTYAEQFFAVPNVSFNILQSTLMGPFGSAFIRKAKRLNRPVFAWTVNEEKKMQWVIHKGLDGNIGDDPKKFLEACEKWQGQRPKFQFKELFAIFRLQCFVLFFTMYVRWKFGMFGKVDRRFVSTSGKPRRAAKKS